MHRHQQLVTLSGINARTCHHHLPSFTCILYVLHYKWNPVKITHQHTNTK